MVTQYEGEGRKSDGVSVERYTLEQVERKAVHSNKVPTYFLDRSLSSYVAFEESQPLWACVN